MTQATRILRAITIGLLAAAVLLYAACPWVVGPDSARMGGTASVLLLASIGSGIAWAIRCGAKL